MNKKKLDMYDGLRWSENGEKSEKEPKKDAPLFFESGRETRPTCEEFRDSVQEELTVI